MFSKKINNQAKVNDLIAARWSGRAYDETRWLVREQIISLLEAARWAPSCYGDQPWRFLVFNKITNRAAWEQALSCLAEGNQEWAKKAPLLLLACANSIFRKTGNANRWGQYDAGAASENLSLQATAMGLMVHQMGGFNTEQARTLFGIPTEFMPMAMLSVGYQQAEADIQEDIREREYAQRIRNPLVENFFEGYWENPVELES